MAVAVKSVVEEAIRFEHTLAALYQIFSSTYEEDSDLWWELSISEEGHATLLESSSALFEEEFSRDTMTTDLEALRASNDALESKLALFGKQPPPREEAFRIALALESDENELTLHRLLETSPTRPAREVVIRLRDEDSAHERRIRDYANQQGISL